METIKVKVKSGVIKSNEAKRLQVEIPAGWSGAQLAKWKQQNESAIVAALQELNSDEVIAENDEEHLHMQR